MPGEAEQRGGLGGLLHPQRGQRVEVGVGILGALVAPGRDQHPDLGAGRRPLGQRAPGRDLGIVGVGVDGERARDIIGGHDVRR